MMTPDRIYVDHIDDNHKIRHIHFAAYSPCRSFQTHHHNESNTMHETIHHWAYKTS